MMLKRKSISSGLFDGMFINDEHGNLFFFPWGKRKKGYLLENANLRTKIRIFYWLSFLVTIAAISVLASRQSNFWFDILTALGCSLGWLAVWYLYSSGITKSSKTSVVDYSEITLLK